MDLVRGSTVEVKKPHPCGGKEFTLTRVGMDVKLKCATCGREVMLPRKKAEKAIKKVLTVPEEAKPGV
ncbi:MAG: DUF951 domain-containing protein [Clostridia bacterium]|nr:DUF951 domain-containing protein [Clostridia bacterium]